MSRKPKFTGADDVTTTSQTVAAGQLRAFVDRILRLREEQDTIGDDVKEVYAELKGVGFDRTAVGALVTELRRKAKDGEQAMQERDAILDLYRTAYEAAAPKPSHTHAYARTRGEGKKPDLKVVGKPADGGADITMKHTNIATELPPHDAETGEILDDKPETIQSQTQADDAVPSGDQSTATNLRDGASGRLSVATSSQPQGMEDAGGDSVERHASNSPETATQAPMVVYGDSAAGRRSSQASLSKSHPAGISEGMLDGADPKPAAPISVEIQERLSTNDEASPEAGPQAEASLVGIDTGMLADREGRNEGEAASVDLPTNSEIKPDPSLSEAHDGEPKPSPAPSSAKSEVAHSLVGQVGEEPGSHIGSNAGQAVTISDADVPAFLKAGVTQAITRLRPHCLNPSECAGYGRVHCHKCTTAMEAKS